MLPYDFVIFDVRMIKSEDIKNELFVYTLRQIYIKSFDFWIVD